MKSNIMSIPRAGVNAYARDQLCAVVPLRPKISHDTVEALEVLLQLARDGDITGLAYGVTTRKQNCYFTNATGQCYEQPTFTRGMLATLGDELGRVVSKRDLSSGR
jgi:hypothetical protein